MRFAILLALPILLVACVTDGVNPNDPIVGEWEAVAGSALLNLEFFANGNVARTWRAPGADGTQERLDLGRWQRQGPGYAIGITDERPMVCRIDDEGYLLVTVGGNSLRLVRQE